MAATLATGQSMPLVGLGTWQATGPGIVEAAIGTALEAGYRHIDCAAAYGNETECGTAFTKAFASGVCSRDEVFITSKLWNSEHAPEHVRPAIEQTLRELQLESLDLYLIHWPQAFQHVDGSTHSFPRDAENNIIYDLDSTLIETWAAMEKLVAAGLTKSIGLSNFNEAQIQTILDNSTIKVHFVLSCRAR